MTQTRKSKSWQLPCNLFVYWDIGLISNKLDNSGAHVATCCHTYLVFRFGYNMRPKKQTHIYFLLMCLANWCYSNALYKYISSNSKPILHYSTMKNAPCVLNQFSLPFPTVPAFRENWPASPSDQRGGISSFLKRKQFGRSLEWIAGERGCLEIDFGRYYHHYYYQNIYLNVHHTHAG